MTTERAPSFSTSKDSSSLGIIPPEMEPSATPRVNSAWVMRGMRLAGSFTSRSTPGAEVTSTSASARSAPASWLATVSPLMLSGCPSRSQPRQASTGT